ncbi:MAG: hypothetical protein H6710_17565 [Myxococcales bacterium]|nr:hypothetical protein [Myxococcales bacterium]
MPVRRPLALGITLALALGCGDATPPPPPAAAPEDFDDPAAARAARAGAPPPAAAPAPAEPAAAEPATGSTGAAGEPAVPNDMSEKTDALAEAAPATEPAADEASPRAAATKGAKEPGATKAPAKAPTTPTPAPAEEPPPRPRRPPPTPPPRPPQRGPQAPHPPPPGAPPPPPQQRLAGTWTYVGGESQRTRLGEAIEAAVQQLNPVIRGIGRKRLTESNKIRESITITVDGDRVTTIFVAGRPVSGTLGGPAFDWTNDEGKTIKVRFTLVKGRLVQDFTDKDGARRNTFTVDASGDKLNLSVTISSDRLDTPMKYALSYRRK